MTGGNLHAACSELVHFADSYDHIIASDSLKGCTVVKTVTMDSNIQYIGAYAFNGCSSLTSVTWSSNLLEIGSHAFSGCISLTQLILPSKVEVIRTFAFWGMTGLTKIVFPETLRVADVVLGNSPKLEHMSVTNTGGTAAFEVKNSYYLYTKGCAVLKYMVPRSGITLNLDSACTNISLYAMAYSRCGPTLTFPDQVLSIDGWVIQWSETVTDVCFGSNICYIHGSAFSDCSTIRSYTVSSSNEYYSSYSGLLYNKDQTKLLLYPTAKTDTTLYLPKNIHEFEFAPFEETCPITRFLFSDGSLSGTYCYITSDKTSLISNDGKTFIRTITKHGGANFSIPEGVEVVGYGACSLTKIGHVTLPSTCKHLETYAFFSSTLKTINLDNVVTTMGSVFEGSGLQSITIPGTWSDVPGWMFFNNHVLSSVTINEGPRAIGASTFRNCPVTLITLPQSLVRIEQRAFWCCPLTSITLPDKCLEYIGWEAFYNTNIQLVTVPKCVRHIESRAFSLCRYLTKVSILNCETFWYPDSFLSTEEKVQVKCISTRRFTDARDFDKRPRRQYTNLFRNVCSMAMLIA